MSWYPQPNNSRATSYYDLGSGAAVYAAQLRQTSYTNQYATSGQGYAGRDYSDYCKQQYGTGQYTQSRYSHQQQTSSRPAYPGQSSSSYGPARTSYSSSSSGAKPYDRSTTSSNRGAASSRVVKTASAAAAIPPAAYSSRPQLPSTKGKTAVSSQVHTSTAAASLPSSSKPAPSSSAAAPLPLRERLAASKAAAALAKPTSSQAKSNDGENRAPSQSGKVQDSNRKAASQTPSCGPTKSANSSASSGKKMSAPTSQTGSDPASKVTATTQPSNEMVYLVDLTSPNQSASELLAKPAVSNIASNSNLTTPLPKGNTIALSAHHTAMKTISATPTLATAQNRINAAMTPAMGNRYMVTPGQDYILTPDSVVPARSTFSHSSMYYYNSEIELNECSTVEFKAAGGGKRHGNYHRDVFPNHIDRYVGGFLNSHKGGMLMLGVSDNGRVCGMYAPRAVQREMEDILFERLYHFTPSISSKYYHFSFKPVYSNRGGVMHDLFVAVLEVHPLTSSSDVTTIFESSDRKAYMKCDGSVQELSITKLVEHVKASYDKVLKDRLIGQKTK